MSLVTDEAALRELAKKYKLPVWWTVYGKRMKLVAIADVYREALELGPHRIRRAWNETSTWGVYK